MCCAGNEEGKKKMEWEERQQQQQLEEEEGIEQKRTEVRVMTEEQIEVLRRQISVYSFICQLLVDLHKSFNSHNHSLSGMNQGNICGDAFMTSGNLSMVTRQRWAPSPTQLQVLEQLFRQGNGTPSKKKIKEITSQLTQHGQISETNVYNWFQNRRARSKRKQLKQSATNAESEVETEAESPEEKKAKEWSIHSHENSTLRTDNRLFPSLVISSQAYPSDPPSNQVQELTTTQREGWEPPGNYNSLDGNAMI